MNPLLKAFLNESAHRKSLIVSAYISAVFFVFSLLFISQLLLPADIQTTMPYYRRRIYLRFDEQSQYPAFYKKIDEAINEGLISHAFLYSKIQGENDLLAVTAFDSLVHDLSDDSASPLFYIDPVLIPPSYRYHLENYTLIINGHTVQCKGLNWANSSMGFPGALINLEQVPGQATSIDHTDGNIFSHPVHNGEYNQIIFPWNQYLPLGLSTFYTELVFLNEISEPVLHEITNSLPPDSYEPLHNQGMEYLEDLVSKSHQSTADSVPIAILVFAFLLINQLILVKTWINSFRTVIRRLQVLGCPKKTITLILMIFSLVLYLSAFLLAWLLFEPLKAILIQHELLPQSRYTGTSAVLLGTGIIFLLYAFISVQQAQKDRRFIQ